MPSRLFSRVGTGMDPLSIALQGLRFSGFVHSRNVFTAPWGFRVPASGKTTAALYGITSGNCWIEVESAGDPIELRAGDVAWVIGNVWHQVRDQPRSGLRRIHEIVTPEAMTNRGGVKHGGGGSPTTFVCGAFELHDLDPNGFIAALPKLIRVRAGTSDAAPWIQSIVEALEHESTTFHPGAQSTLDFLAQALFTCAVRAYAAQSRNHAGDWISAISDPFIGPVLTSMKQQPQAPWTVASLARSVRMSRSAFSARFTSLVGTSPLKHLKNERMRRARRLLSETRAPLKEIAYQAGYTSEAAFNTAFKQLHGISPGVYRRREHAATR